MKFRALCSFIFATATAAGACLTDCPDGEDAERTIHDGDYRVEPKFSFTGADVSLTADELTFEFDNADGIPTRVVYEITDRGFDVDPFDADS